MILLLVLVACALSGQIYVDTNTGLFVDSLGRVRVHHGVNAVYKTHPFHPQTTGFDSNSSLSDIDLYTLKSLGMNVIRLHVAWEGVEPKKGEYNYTYLEVLQSIVRACKNYNIQVLLDSHQDLFSKKFCGQGFPDWAVEKRSFPHPLPVKMRFDNQGYPYKQDCLNVEFGLFYTTFDVMRFQQDFFTGKGGYDVKFAQMWGLVAKYMTGETNILGYEILNEPQGADLWRSIPNVIFPGVSNNKFLLPFYKKVYKEIRKYDKNTLIFFQPSAADILSGGFLQTPGGQNELHKQVFSYHVYCPAVNKLGQPTSALVCKAFDFFQVHTKVMNAKRLKCGMMLTEFGALSDSKKSASEVARVTGNAQRNFNGWIYWQFKYYEDITTAARPGTTESFYDQNGKLQTNKVKALSHSYAYAICGVPLRTSWTDTSVTLVYVPKDCSTKHTQFYLNQIFYFPSGVTFATLPACPKCRLTKLQKSYYQFSVPESVLNRKLKVTITGK